MKCTKCEKKIDIAIVDPVEGVLCETCHFYLYPPLMTLIKRWDSDLLCDPKTGTKLTFSSNLFESCGFELHVLKQFLNEQKSSDIKELRIYRYFGHLRCNMVKEYRWPLNARHCLHPHCPPRELRRTSNGNGRS